MHKVGQIDLTYYDFFKNIFYQWKCLFIGYHYPMHKGGQIVLYSFMEFWLFIFFFVQCFLDTSLLYSIHKTVGKKRWPTTSAMILRCSSNGHFTIHRPWEMNGKDSMHLTLYLTWQCWQGTFRLHSYNTHSCFIILFILYSFCAHAHFFNVMKFSVCQ